MIFSDRTFATFNAAKELPFDLEDALLLWLNKINNTNDRRIQKTKSPESSSEISPRRFRFKKDQKVDKPENLFPKLDDLQSDLADGKTLLSLVLFYCPDTLTHEGILFCFVSPLFSCQLDDLSICLEDLAFILLCDPLIFLR